MRKSNLMMVAVAVMAVVFSATSCLKSESEYEKQVKIDDKILADFIAAQSVTAQKHSTGFYYQVIEPNDEGAALKKNDVVIFDYSIYTLSGTLIQTNTIEGGVPAMLKLQTMTVIPEALDYGVSLMKVGEKYRFYIPSYLAYGSYSTADFSPHTNFIVDLEVTDVKSEDEIEAAQKDSIANYVAEHYPEMVASPSGLYFLDSIPGTGSKPMSNSVAVVDIKRRYLDNTVTMSNDAATIYLDRNLNAPGLEEGIKLTKEGGTSVLVMPASIGFRQSVCVIPQKTRAKLYEQQIINNNIEPYSILKYTVKLKSVMY